MIKRRILEIIFGEPERRVSHSDTFTGKPHKALNIQSATVSRVDSRTDKHAEQTRANTQRALFVCVRVCFLANQLQTAHYHLLGTKSFEAFLSLRRHK